MRKKEVWTVLYLMLLMLILGVFTVSAAATSQTPHGVKGYVLWPNGSQYSYGVSVSVNDTTAKTFVNATTGGPTGHPGWYSVSVNGTDGDKIIIKAINNSAYGYKEVTLDGDMSSVNATLELPSNAPTLDSAYLEVTKPSKSMDLRCLTKEHLITEPQGLAVELNYTWYRNGVEQGNSLFELENDTDTLFLARWDTDLNATASVGNRSPIVIGNPLNVSGGKFSQALNISNGDVLMFNASDGNINTSQGSIEFWFNPIWSVGSSPNNIVAFFYSGIATSDRIRVYYVNSVKKMFFMRGSKVISELVPNWNAGEWHHIAVTWGTRYDSAQNTYFNMQRLYADGKLIAYDDTVIATTTLPPVFYIGAYNTAANPAYSKIDEFRIYGRELTPQEINRDYSGEVVDRRFVNETDSWSCEITPYSGNKSKKGPTYASSTAIVQNYSVSYVIKDYANHPLNRTLKAGKPSSISLTILKDGLPVNNANVKVTEVNGYSPFAYVQTTTTNVTNDQIANARTNASGVIEFTIIPTGGRFDTEETHEFYNLILDVYDNDDHIYREYIPVEPKDRDVANMRAKSYVTTAAIVNAADFGAVSFTSQILNLYARINYFLGGGDD